MGDVPWGTHFCYFYETKQDLVDTLVPFFRSGLAHGDFCLWVIFEPLTTEEALAALDQAAPDLLPHLAAGKVEIRPHEERFFQAGPDSPNCIVSHLRENLQSALSRGHTGMRVAGSSAGLQKSDGWRFAQFEREIERAVTGQRMIALCAFPPATSGAAEIFDAARTHQFAVARRQGEWQTLETPDEKRAKAEIRKLNQELELRVVERTRALAAVNEELRREIEDRKQAETELRRQKDVLQTIFDHMPLMIHFVGVDHQLKLVNREWERTLGWTLEEIRGQNLDILAENYPDPTYRRDVEEFLRTTSDEWRDFKTQVRDGRVIDISWSILYLSDGTAIGIGQDITARKRAEEALRDSEERFRQLAENIREIFWIKTADRTRALYLSPAYESITGRPREDEHGQRRNHFFVDIMHPEDRERMLETARTKMSAEYDVEFRIVRPDRSIRWIRDRGFPVRDSSGRLCRMAGVAEDITEQKQAQESLQASSEQLRALSMSLQSAREREAATIARRIHDELGGTLTSLRWELEGLAKFFDQQDSPARLAAVGEQLDLLFRLTDATIHSVRRIASEMRPSILDDIGLAEAIEWQSGQFQSQTGIECDCQVAAAGLSLDAEQSTAVFRILQEALTNVRRHAQASRASVALEECDGVLVLTVHDDGKGITQEQASSRQSLGLVGMRERAYLAGGSIEIGGAPGEGTTVCLRIPPARGDELIAGTKLYE